MVNSDAYQYVESNHPGLYFAASAQTKLNRTSLFLINGAGGTKQITLDQALDHPLGTFVFLKEPLADTQLAAAFDILTRFLTTPVHYAAWERFLWVDFQPTQQDLGRFFTLPIRSADQNRPAMTAETATFNMGHLDLVIGAGCPVVAQPRKGSVRIQRSQADSPGMIVTCERGLKMLGPAGPLLTLPLFGPNAGCLHFDLRVPPALQQHGYQAMNAGFMLFQEPKHDHQPAFYTTYRLPLLMASSSDRVFRVQLDPLRVYDGRRTFFSLYRGEHSSRFPSYYRTNTGHRVWLTPLRGGRLVFLPKPNAAFRRVHQDHYLAPAGPFAVAMAPQPSVLCGLSGLEYLRAQGTPLGLDFKPGQPAMIREQPRLSLHEQAVTSWASPFVPAQDGRAHYYSQPEHNALHQLSNGDSHAGTPADYSYFEVVTGHLDHNSSLHSPIPLFPYAGYQGRGTANLTRWEWKLFSSRRRIRFLATHANTTEIQPMLDDTATPVGGQVITTHGFPVQLDQHGNWHKLILARISPHTLAFTGIRTDLRDALLTNQLFLVISDPRQVATMFTSTVITIQGWTFDMGTTTWLRNAKPEHDTLLLFKFHRKSLGDLIAQTDEWTMADAFNRDPDATSDHLQTFCRQAVEELAGNPNQSNAADPFLKHFVEVVLHGDWQGFLALNVHMPISGLPTALEGLAAGLDTARFRAHHLGVGLNKLEPTTDSGTIRSGGLFGLINYQAPSRDTHPEDEFVFEVLKLRVRFANSSVAAFASDVRLWVNSLLGSPTKGDATLGRAVTLSGTYQKHRSKPSYAFLAPPGQAILLASGALQRVVIRAADFVTRQPGKHADDQQVHTRFILSGSLCFQELPLFDVFSFGVGNRGLTFHELRIDMDFPRANPKQVRFDLDGSHLRLTSHETGVRPHSLFAHFPLNIQTLIRQTQSPMSLGYEQAGTPLQVASSLPATWNGLVFRLRLGTLGKMASVAGLYFDLLAAWDPHGDQVWVGLKKPDLKGIPTLGVEGVLGLSWQSFQFLRNGAAYLLKLRQISLDILHQKLPPEGRIDILIFGDPQGTATGKLAWFGAYNNLT